MSSLMRGEDVGEASDLLSLQEEEEAAFYEVSKPTSSLVVILTSTMCECRQSHPPATLYASDYFAISISHLPL